MKPILIADDDAAEAFLTTRALKSAGVQNPLVVVPDAAGAVAYLSGAGPYADRARHPLPCLVLLDQKLPGSSGLEVLEWVRKSALCTLPVLVLSSSDFDGDVQAAYLLGANGYLVKPARYEDMLEIAVAIKAYWLTANRAPSPSRI